MQPTRSVARRREGNGEPERHLEEEAMIHAMPTPAPGGGAPALRIFVADEEGRAAYWRINGFRARILIWTPEEWAGLRERPDDAQYHPSGVWCALRIE
jgi:hypothetical protein